MSLALLPGLCWPMKVGRVQGTTLVLWGGLRTGWMPLLKGINGSLLYGLCTRPKVRVIETVRHVTETERKTEGWRETFPHHPA